MMKAQIFDIVDCAKENEFFVAARGDFTLGNGTDYDARLILESSDITLYCLDPEERQAIFVETSPGANITAAPFYYIGQFEHAVRVIVVSYDVLFALAEQIPLEDERLILIYSIGRSGTTVTSAAFECAQDVVSLSEPDVFTQLVHMRDFSGSNDAEIRALTAACTRLSCKDFVHGQQPFWVLKFRSFVIEIADLLYAHYPRAKSLFLYRNAESWTASMIRAFGGDGVLSQQDVLSFWMWSLSLNSKISAYRVADISEINMALLASFMWLNGIEQCLARMEAGQPILPVRYGDLRANPLTVTRKLFEYCGVKPGSEAALERVFAKDAQANTSIAREKTQQKARKISLELSAALRAIIAEHPVIRTSDYQIPGTLTISG
jgi:hypothetical protein